MRDLVALAGLTVGLLSPVVLTTPAQAVGETCNGLAATLVGTPGSTVTGTDGADVIVSNGATLVEAMGGDDVICTTSSVHTSGNVYWVGVLGGAGNDVLDRRGDTDPKASSMLRGDAGQDTIYGSPASDVVKGNDGEADRVETFGGDDQVGESFVAGEPADPDTVDLGSGDDVFAANYPFSPSLTVDGADGLDRIDMQLSTDGSWVVDARGGRLRHGSDAAFGFGGFESYDAEIRQPRGSVTFLGTDAGERFTATARRVTAKTAGGNDTVELSELSRHIAVDAGPGRDAVSLWGRDLAVLTVDLPRQRLRETARSQTVSDGSIRHVEDVDVDGGTVRVIGTSTDNVLTVRSCRGAVVTAGAGDDEIILSRRPFNVCLPGTAPHAYGGPGDDVLLGSAVADVLDGGPGHDRADGKRGRDICRSVETSAHCELR